MGRVLAVGAAAAIAEVVLLVLGFRHFGGENMLLYVLGTAVLGFFAAKLEGWRVLVTWRLSLMRLQVPAHGLVSALLVLVAGALLLMPGPVTDLCGLLLLLPPVRRSAASGLRSWIERKLAGGGLTWSWVQGPRAAAPQRGDIRGQVIDVEAVGVEAAPVEPTPPGALPPRT